MERLVVAASIFNLFSGEENLETQLVFGEVLDSPTFSPPRLPVYQALEQETLVEGAYAPYPGYGTVYEIDEFNPFFSTLIPIDPSYKPNVVVKTLDAKLLPWDIPLPYGTYLQVDVKGNVFLPFLRGIFDPIYQKVLRQAYCSLEHIAPIPKQLNICNLLQDAYSMLGIPYLYGGRTAFCVSSKFMGLDCSGFVNILFRAQGIRIPRNASDQYAYCVPVSSFKNLPVGGLIFLKEEGVLNHVMIKSARDEIIHASLSSGCVNVIKDEEAFSIEKDIMFLSCKDKEKGSVWKKFEALFGFPAEKQKAQGRR
ncbi:C40 family peptidase [Chlamydiifrater volucris]|uniref:C40 family peptidase n=1 Tax=Chlamydiifrater volucris TaxID=2681470 RepID=UPI0032B20A1B